MMENQLNQVFLVKRISKFLSLSKKLGLEIEIIKKLESLISSYNGNLYIIGGNVRDLILNKKISSGSDLVVDLKVNQLTNILRKNKIEFTDVGINFGSIVVHYKKQVIEVTSMRKDLETDGRWAKIEYTNSLLDDALRRDFTINSIYCDTKGRIFDPFNGIQDLMKGKVKFIGEPIERIEEDYLRILRFIRFSFKYSKTLDKSGMKFCLLKKNKIKNLSFERRINEIRKILVLKNIENKTNIEKIKLFIELSLGKKINTTYFSDLCKIERKIKIISSLRRLKFLLRFNKLNKNSISEMRLSNRISERLTDKTKIHSHELNKIKIMIYNYDKEIIIDQLIFDRVDKKISNSDFNMLLKFVIKYTPKKFPLNGKDIINQGFSEGKTIGIILQKMKKWWLEKECLPNKKDCLSYLKKLPTSRWR
tara:strand:- start:28 stop:1290 length:1263 start_codon:yes stop_codon:yes gene_type:complete